VWKYFGIPVSYVDNVHASKKLCYVCIRNSSTDRTTKMAGHLRRHQKNIDLSVKQQLFVYSVKTTVTKAKLEEVNLL